MGGRTETATSRRYPRTASGVWRAPASCDLCPVGISGAKPSDEFPSLAAEISGTRGAELTRFTRLTHSILHAIARPESAAMLGLSIAAIYSVCAPNGHAEGGGARDAISAASRSVVVGWSGGGQRGAQGGHLGRRHAYGGSLSPPVCLRADDGLSGVGDAGPSHDSHGDGPRARGGPAPVHRHGRGAVRARVRARAAPSHRPLRRSLADCDHPLPLASAVLSASRTATASPERSRLENRCFAPSRLACAPQTTFASELRQLAETRPRHVRDAACAVSRRVRLGREPLFPGIEQRIIRLCGRQSDVTEVSLLRYGPHIVPVFERPAAVATLIHAHSRALREPVYWQVSEGGCTSAVPRPYLGCNSAASRLHRGCRSPRGRTRSLARGTPSRGTRTSSSPQPPAGGSSTSRRDIAETLPRHLRDTSEEAPLPRGET